MQAIELNLKITSSGDIHIPEEYKETYGTEVRLIILARDKGMTEDGLSELLEKTRGIWTQEDGLEYQMKIRNEWERDGQVSE